MTASYYRLQLIAKPVNKTAGIDWHQARAKVDFTSALANQNARPGFSNSGENYPCGIVGCVNK